MHNPTFHEDIDRSYCYDNLSYTPVLNVEWPLYIAPLLQCKSLLQADAIGMLKTPQVIITK